VTINGTHSLGLSGNRNCDGLKPRLTDRTLVLDIGKVKGSEFLRKVKKLAERRGLSYRWVPDHGRGSHGRLYLGDRFTTIKDRKKEISPSLLGDMCRQLDIEKREL
jgi:mRNA interferase HicA